MPRSEWLAQWSLRYAQKCSKSWVKNSGAKFPATTPGCFMLKITLLDDVFSEVFQPQASSVGKEEKRREKRREKEKKERQKKNSKNWKA